MRPGSNKPSRVPWQRAISYRIPVPSAISLHRRAAPAQESDSAAVAAVIERYHHALATGDSALALTLLANDVVVLDSGGVDTRDEYRSHHRPADDQFARAVPMVLVRTADGWRIAAIHWSSRSR